MKTIIELFDEYPVENIIAALNFKPEKVVFVGFKNEMTNKRKSDIEKFFALKNINIKIEYEIVGRYNFEEIENTLNSIVDRNEDCCFDLTGGKELVLVAMGAISAERKIPMVQFDIKTGDMTRVKNCEEIEETSKAAMTIKENTVLFGGAVEKSNNTLCEWDINDEFVKEIEILWKIAGNNETLWNKKVFVLKEAEARSIVEESLSVEVNLSYLQNRKYDETLCIGLLKQLAKSGLLLNYSYIQNTVKYTYKNEQIKKCLQKAGNVLELYTYICALEINKEESDYFSDIDIGIFLDWDGVLHEGITEHDTKNEVDVMMMRGLCPVFVSCKNGEVKKEDLYELHAVGEKFGGDNARKILLASFLSKKEESRKYLIQRATDMSIKVLYNVKNMDKEKFKAELKRVSK